MFLAQISSAHVDNLPTADLMSRKVCDQISQNMLNSAHWHVNVINESPERGGGGGGGATTADVKSDRSVEACSYLIFVLSLTHVRSIKSLP